MSKQSGAKSQSQKATSTAPTHTQTIYSSTGNRIMSCSLSGPHRHNLHVKCSTLHAVRAACHPLHAVFDNPLVIINIAKSLFQLVLWKLDIKCSADYLFSLSRHWTVFLLTHDEQGQQEIQNIFINISVLYKCFKQFHSHIEWPRRTLVGTVASFFGLARWNLTCGLFMLSKMYAF